jgi:hypothetical protein
MMLGSAVSQWSRTENGRSLHSPGGRWAFLFAIVVSALVSTTDEASSQPVDPGAKLQFDMPSQPLASALNAFGVTTRLELFYESTLSKVIDRHPFVASFHPTLRCGSCSRALACPSRRSSRGP